MQVRKASVFILFSSTLIVLSCIMLLTLSEMSILNIAGIVVIYLLLPFFFTLVAFGYDFSELRTTNIATLLAISVMMILSMGPVATIASGGWTHYHPFNSVASVLSGHLNTDTAMHAAIINSIARVGYPSTGLHGDVLYFYHVGTHYFDALFVWLSGQIALDIYGKVSYLKTIAIIIGVAHFSLKLTNSNNLIIVLCHFFASMVLLFYDGHIVGSHSLWLPSLLLLLSWPSLSKILEGKLDLVTITSLGIIGIVIALGKVSLGLPFMFVVGMSIFLANVRDLRVVALGTVWVLFLLAYSQAFQDRLGVASQFRTLDYHSSAMLLPFCGVMALLNTSGWCRRAFIPLSVYFILMVSFIWTITPNQNDHWYFNNGFFFMCSLFILTDIGRLFGKHKYYYMNVPPVSRAAFGTSEASNLRLWIDFRLSADAASFKVSSAFGNLVILALLSFLFVKISIISLSNIARLNYYPFYHSNMIAQSKESRSSVFREIISFWDSEKSRPEKRDRYNIYTFRKSLEEFSASRNISHLPIFMPATVWQEIANLAKGKDDWRTALRVAAVLGRPILNGVPKKHPYYYGYHSYRGGGLRVHSLRDVDCKGYSRFINITRLRPPVFTVQTCRQ